MTIAMTERLQCDRSARATDARGRPVTLLDPHVLNLLHRHDIIEAEPLREIAREVGPGVTRWHRRVYWIGFAAGLSSISSALFQRSRSGVGIRFAGIGDVIILSFFVIFLNSSATK